MDESLDNLIKFTGTVYAYADPKQTHISFPVTFYPKQTMDKAPMKLSHSESTSVMKAFVGAFSDGTEFKLLVYCTGELSPNALSRGIRHKLLLFVGDKFEKSLLGTFYVFDYT